MTTGCPPAMRRPEPDQTVRAASPFSHQVAGQTHRIAAELIEVGFDGDVAKYAARRFAASKILALDVDLPGPNPLLLSELMQDVLGRSAASASVFPATRHRTA